MIRSFWKDALASLPPAVQRRYAADFEMAERLDRAIEFYLDAVSTGKRALAKACCLSAYAFRATAQWLEGAAERLLLMY